MQEIVIYHALPYGLCDGLRNPIRAELYVDISRVIEKKVRMLAFHQSQKQWLDESQGLDSYLITMREMSAEVGRMSGLGYAYAEGWRRRSHLGFSSPDRDPLSAVMEAG